MATKKILFWPDISYEPGHWRPVMSMAEKILALNEGGGEDEYEIAFLCTPECKTIITRHNPDWNIKTIFPELYPEGYSSLASEKPEEANSRMEHCLKIAEGEFDSIMSSYNPDIIVAGFFVSMEALLLRYKYKRPIAITTTYLRHPNEDPAITSMRFLAFHAQEISSRLMNAADSTGNYNGSTASITKFIRPLTKVPELITCPRELEHSNFVHTRERTTYVEPSILIEPVPEAEDPPTYPYITYSSAGSRVRDYVESAKKLFNILQKTADRSEFKNRLFQLAVGYKLKEEFRDFKGYKRVEIVEWANQVEKLQHATSAVIHGGLATIKECIYYGVPMVVVPFGKDQMDNALRIVNNKVGRLEMLDTLSADKMSRALMDVEGNKLLNENLTRMKDLFVKREAEKPSVNIILTTITEGDHGDDE